MKKNLRAKAFLSLLCGALVSLNAQAQFPEGFETGVPPMGWAVFNNGIGLFSEWTSDANANSGAQAAYVGYENVTGIAEDWLVTPQFVVNAGNPVLEFYQAQSYTSDYGSQYFVMVSTVDQTTTANFTTVDTQVETDFGTSYDVHYVNLSNYVGQAIYVAFVMMNDDGDDWFIDDVNMISAPCAAPINLAANNITTNSADLSWMPFATGTNFNVAVLPNGSPSPTSGTAVTGTSYPASGLNAATLYDFYVQEVCGITEPLIISAAFDGPLPLGLPKGVELYVVKDIPDLSIYGISSANNGAGPTGTPEYTFPADAVSAGTYLYVTTDSAGFFDYFGVQTNYISGAMSINGDDAVELFKNGSVIDVFGDVNVDGTGTPWEYLDGWAYRNSGSMTNGGVFDIAEWSFSGINATDGCTTNGGCGSVQPIGTFVTSDDVSPWSLLTFQTDCGVLLGDDAANPIEVPSLPYVDSSSNSICYTDQIDNASPDVFYMYAVDPCYMSIDIELCGSDFDTYLWIYDQNFTLLNSSDDECGLQSAIYDFSLLGYDTLYIIVEGYGSSVGQYTLNITPGLSMPAPALLSQTDVICGGESTGSATVGTGDPSASYLWDANAGNQTDSVAVGLSAGSYVVTVSYPGGCEYTETVTIIDLNPALVLTANATDETFGADGSIDLSVGGGAGPYSYSWNNGAGTGEDPSGLAGNTTYTVTVTDFNGCEGTLDVFVGSVVGLENLSTEALFGVYPNPNNGLFIVRMQEAEAVTMEMINALGQQVKIVELTGTETSVQAGDLEKGSYTLRFTLKSGKTVFGRIVLM